MTDEVFDRTDQSFEIWLSTDGKHTVKSTCPPELTIEEMKVRTVKAINLYKFIVKELGTKAEMWQGVMDKKNGVKPVADQQAVAQQQTTCQHPAEMVKIIQVKKEGPNKGKYFKTCKACDKFLGFVK